MPTVRGDDLDGVFYTGGTTGLCPRACMLSHDNLIISAMGAMRSTATFMTPDGRFLHAAPMFHLADLAAWSVATAQRRHPRHRPGVRRRSGVLTAIAEHQVTDALLVPTMIQMLVDHPDAGEVDLSQPAAHPLRRLADRSRPCSTGPEGLCRTRRSRRPTA